MVRLEDERTTTLNYSTNKFQFQDGAIRGVTNYLGKKELSKFQFQDGAIRGLHPFFLCPKSVACFNSKMVRLEAF